MTVEFQRRKAKRVSQEALTALVVACMVLALGVFWQGIRSGEARPPLWAWAVRVAITAVAFLSQLGLGATYSLALSGSQVLFGVVLLYWIGRHARPRGARFTRTDGAMLAVAVFGMGFIVAGYPLASMLGVIVADTCATCMSMHASWRDGMRESVGFWLLCLLAAAISIVAAVNTPGVTVWIVCPLVFSATNAGVNVAMSLYMKRQSVRVLMKTQPQEG